MSQEYQEIKSGNSFWLWLVRIIWTSMIPIIWSAYNKLASIETNQAVMSEKMSWISVKVGSLEDKISRNEQDEIKRLRKHLGE